MRPISIPPARDTTNDIKDNIATDNIDTFVLDESEVLVDDEDDDDVDDAMYSV